MYKLLTMAQDEDSLIFNLSTEESKHIYWCLTTNDNKVPIENLTTYKEEAAIDEFEYFFVSKKQIQRIADEICDLEANNTTVEIVFTNFHQLVRCLLEKKTVAEILKENK